MSSQESPAVHRKCKQKVFALSVDANSSKALAAASTSYISSAQFESMQDDLISSNEVCMMYVVHFLAYMVPFVV